MKSKKNKILYRTLLLMLIAGVLNACNSQKEEKISSLSFDVKEVAFSYPKSGFSVCQNERTKGLALTDVRHAMFGYGNTIFKIMVGLDSDTLSPNSMATPAELTLFSKNLEIGRACFESEAKFRLKGKDQPMSLLLDKKLVSDNKIIVSKINDKSYRIQNNNYSGVSRHIITCLKGVLEYNADQSLFTLALDKNKYFEILVEEVNSTWSYTGSKKSFEECVESNEAAFQDWLAKMPTVPDEYAEARKLAAYILWSCELEGGNLKRPAMLMSKNWMHYVWSWDHCFNAMACAYELPEAAWNNYIVPFDAQNETGQLPDPMGYSRMSFKYVKPPIHGWALRKLMAKMEFSDEQLEHVYTSMVRWTNFWLNHRDSNKNGMPEYHHGNDSGWDNGTEFDINGKTHQFGVFESANLAAYLILQMDMLSELAVKLGKDEESQLWKQKSDDLLALMIKNHWKDGKFVTINIENNHVNDSSQSLMAILPIVLGKKLSAEIQSALVDELKNGGYLTEWGLATESTKSLLFKDDAYYWRGPIWAPSTMIIVDGLKSIGEDDLALEITRKYCKLCSKNGFAENFDAKMGDGLCDLGYTWTASVFLVMAHENLVQN